MEQSLDLIPLSRYVTKQVSIFCVADVPYDLVMIYIKKTLERVEHCFSHIKDKYFFDGKKTHFNHLHSDQYAMFLYFLSKTIWEESKDSDFASKIFYLNKSLNGIDAFYSIGLPDIFLFCHCVGTVLGRGGYSDYFVTYHGVTIGGDLALERPSMGKGVAMFPGSALIGKCRTGENCLVSIGSVARDEMIPSNSVVVGRTPDLSYKKARSNVFERYFIV